MANPTLSVSNQAARVFTMLPSTPQVEAVYLGEKGLLAGLAGIQPEPLTDAIAANPWLLGDGGEQPAPTKSHSLFVDHTTLDPTAARRVAEDVHAQNEGVYMLDGPVSGGELRPLRCLTDKHRHRRRQGGLAHDHVRLGIRRRVQARRPAHAVHGAARRRDCVWR